MPPTSHTCRFCSRIFKRAEHLSRHLRTHTREKPFRCQCGTSFTRRDLLTRHWRLSQHLPDSCATSIIVPPSDQDSLHRPTLGPTPNQPNNCADTVNNHDTSLHELQVASNDDRPNSGPYEHDDFADFVNFIDSVGLSVQWTPEYVFDWTDNPEQQNESSNRSPISQNDRRENLRAGTPFSSWLPSAPTGDRVCLRSQSGDHLNDGNRGSGGNRAFQVSSNARDAFVKMFGELPSNVMKSFEIPSRHALTRYISAFFGGFHSHFPFIHEATYSISDAPPELTLAMCAAGAQYCFERRCAYRLFSASRSIMMHHSTQKILTVELETVLDSSSSSENRLSLRPTNSWVSLDAVKTSLILLGFATWEGKPLLDQAQQLRAHLVQCLHEAGLEETCDCVQLSARHESQWSEWITGESSRRTKLVAFCYLNVHSIAYNIPPFLWSRELSLTLPSSTQDWQASSAERWASLTNGTQEGQMLFQDALTILFQEASGTGTIQPIPSPIGSYILLHALIQHIHVARELSRHTGSIPSSEMQACTRALRVWTSLWQQAPESTLDPNNESGPIPFTSSSLLVVAYIRLVFDIGSLRHLETRNPKMIAAGLMQAPCIDHGEGMLPALLYSTHALSIPVRLGIDRIARSQAFFWSVQHALSNFESAVFLSKWLCGLPNSVDANLPQAEARILDWVQRITKEAYAVVDFEHTSDEIIHRLETGEPFALGLAVLNIWSRFFSGNTQWDFIVLLGSSLKELSSLLVG